jgi:hypothetical protein
MGINYFHGHFEGGDKGYSMLGIILFYSMELKLKTLKNSFLCGDFD